MRIRKLLLTLIMSIVLLWALAWSLAASATALTTIRYVAPGGNCGAGITPCYATLQAAINAAVAGDEVRVAQGVYVDVTTVPYPLDGSPTITQAMFITKTLTVRGGYTLTNWTTAEPANYPTVINPQGEGRGSVIASPNPSIPALVTLEGLTIANGYATGSGGGLFAENSDVVIRDCYILSNTNGVVLRNNRSTLINTVIADNRLAGPTVITQTGLIILGGEMQAWHTTLADNGGTGLWVQNLGNNPAFATMTNTIISGHDVVGAHVLGQTENPTIVQLTATLWGINEQQINFNDGGKIIHYRDEIEAPNFVGPDDYRLTATSPARNRGAYSPVRYDIIGVKRDPLPDLGAYEYDDPESIRQVFLPLVMRQATR
ncbi:MAG: right-handed parallel beta-helix repeat-containing protein [Anaerolineae bacterium]